MPLVFTAASLLAKDPRTQAVSPWTPSPQKWIDGSVDNDLPMQRLSEIFNVNHFIVSQVNPHVVPFLAKEEDKPSQDGQQSSSVPARSSWLHGASMFAQSEAIYRLTVMADHGILPNTLTKAASVLSQTYSGDITILPEISYADFPNMLSNPTTNFIVEAMLRGERATWPKLSRIRNHCAIELALDKAVNEVRAKAIFDDKRGILKRTKSEHGNRSWLSLGYETARRRRVSQSSEPDANILEFAKQNGFYHLKDVPHQKTQSLDLVDTNRDPDFSFSRPTIDELRLPDKVNSKVEETRSSARKQHLIPADDAGSSSEDNYLQADTDDSSVAAHSPPPSPIYGSRKNWMMTALTQMTTRGSAHQSEKNNSEKNNFEKKTKSLTSSKEVPTQTAAGNMKKKSLAKKMRKKD